MGCLVCGGCRAGGGGGGGFERVWPISAHLARTRTTSCTFLALPPPLLLPPRFRNNLFVRLLLLALLWTGGSTLDWGRGLRGSQKSRVGEFGDEGAVGILLCSSTPFPPPPPPRTDCTGSAQERRVRPVSPCRWLWQGAARRRRGFASSLRRGTKKCRHPHLSTNPHTTGLGAPCPATASWW